MKLFNVSFLLILLSCAFPVRSVSAGEKMLENKPLPTPREEQRKPTEGEAAITKEAPSVSHTIIINNPSPRAEKNPAGEKPEPWPPMWTIIAGLLVSFGGWAVAIYTVRSIKQQAKAATENVLATRTLANLERPWVVIHPKSPTHWPFDGTRKPPFHTEVRWLEFNFGRSPALVTKFSCSMRILDLPIADVRPEYAPPDEVAPLFLAPNGQRPHDSGLVKYLAQDEFDEICAENKAIVLYGLIEYQDTVEKNSHITRFCFSWFFRDERPIFSPVGPKSYIEYT